jgi:hypothetical protein
MEAFSGGNYYEGTFSKGTNLQILEGYDWKKRQLLFLNRDKNAILLELRDEA